jgi:hypothetical protein
MDARLRGHDEYEPGEISHFLTWIRSPGWRRLSVDLTAGWRRVLLFRAKKTDIGRMLEWNISFSN